MRRVILIVLALVLIASIRTSAQELPTAQKWADVEWFEVTSWQFTGAGADTAMNLLFDVFMPAATETWPEIRCLRHITGEWHVTCIAAMPEGPAGLEWENAPDWVAFITAVIEQQGEAATGIFEMWNTAVARQTNTILIEPTGGM